MSPEEKAQFDQMAKDLAHLKDVYYRNDFADNKVFRQKITSQDQIIADGNGIKMRSNSNPLGVQIRCGDAINDAGIKAEVGTLPNGSVYLSSSSTQPFFIMVGTTWTLLNIP